MASPIVENNEHVSTMQESLFSKDSGTLPPELRNTIYWLQNYKLPSGVIDRLKQKPSFQKMSDAEMEQCIVEFKKFVAILVINQDKTRRIEMISPVIDEVWHTFILFTK